MATKDIFKLAQNFGDDIELYYNDSQSDMMISAENIDTLLEEDFLETVYGIKARVLAD